MTRNGGYWIGPLLLLLLTACATKGPDKSGMADTHRRLGHVKLERGEHENAIREYRASLELVRDDPETHFALSEAFRRKGAFEAAEGHLRDTLRLDSSHQNARLNLSVVLLQQERFDEAIVEATRLVDDPTFIWPSRALVNRGWAYYKSERLELAEADFRAAIRHRNSNVPAHLDLGIVLYDRGEIDEAIVQFETVLEILERRPGDGYAVAETSYRLGQAHVKRGDRKSAVAALQRAIERGGDGEWGEKSKEYLANLR